MALINQQASEAGTAPTGGLGFINPALYSIGQGSNYTSDLHDITSGNNDTDNQTVWYNAEGGYDLVTGWGSPSGQILIDTLAGPVGSGFWLSSSPGSISVAQGATATTTIAVTDAGGFAGSVSLTASGLPSGVTASFSPSTTTGTSLLTLTAAGSATLGSNAITITGVSGSLSSSTSLFVAVNSAVTNPPSTGQLGSINIGGSSNPSTETVTFRTAGTLASVAVLTQGVANLDFTSAGGGSCTIGSAYAANTSCTVNVTFTPRYAGVRYGAVVLSDASGNQLASLYLQGTGVGAQTAFIPGTETTIGSGFLSPESVTVLGDGSVYVADYGNGNGTGGVYLEQVSNGSYTQSKLSCTFTAPSGVVVDGSGTIYVADPGVPAVYKVTLANGNCNKTGIGSGFGAPWAVAVDGSGDVFITDLGTSSISAAVYKETLQANGTYVQTAVGSGWVNPTAVAIENNGNIDVADYAIPGVFRETASGGAYTQTPIGQGWTAPYGIAVDAAGDVYVSDAGNMVQNGGATFPAGVYKEVPAQGAYTQVPIGSGWLIPYGIALDASGSLYVADALRGIYKEDLADAPALGFANTVGGTSSSDSPRIVTVSNIGTAALQFASVAYPGDFQEAVGAPADCGASTNLTPGAVCTLSIDFLPTAPLNGSTSLALNENVSVTTNTLNTTATEQMVAVSGTEVLPTETVTVGVSSNPSVVGSLVTFTATITTPASGPVPTGTVTFYNGSTALSGPLALSGGVATYSTSALPIGTYGIVASYSGDTNYRPSSSNSLAESIVAAPGASGFGNTSIGAQTVGSTSPAIPLTVTFSSAETLATIAVLTQGVPNQDFANAGGGTCSVGTTYAANATCIVNITFAPKWPGTRVGAVVLSDNNGNVIGTGYLEGTGVGAQTAFLPGILTSAATGLSYPQGVAVDGSGNVYVADALNGVVYKETFAGGTYTQTTIGSGFSQPYGIAIDGAGNLYVTDIGNRAVYRETTSNGGYVQTVIGSDLNWPSGVAVDTLGNVYIADFGNGTAPGAVYIETLSNGSYSQSTIGAGFISPQGVAVDAAGNVYVADSANGNGSAAVYKLTPSNGSYGQTTIGSGWVTPGGIAVDANGNLYVADAAYELGDGSVIKEALQSDGTYVQTTALTSASTPYPGGTAVDAKGNVYVADNLNGSVYRDDLADPPAVSFATTMYGAASSDSPKTVSVQNAGNATLTFSALSYPADFPEQAGVPTDCTPSTSLAVGATCTLTTDFTPASLGTSNRVLSEAVTITTNSLNAGAPQAIAVSGTEAAPSAAVILTVPVAVATVGSQITFTATLSGAADYPAPTGSVTFYSGGTALGSSSLNGGTATYSTSSLALGAYSITATYSGDQFYASVTSTAVTVQMIPAATFGTQNVGSSTSSLITVTFSSRATLGSIAVATQGAPNLDFTNAGGGTCTVGSTYAAGATCTVKVAFAPRYPGARYGAIVLGNNKGALIQTIYLQGTGVAAQIGYPTRTFSAISSSVLDMIPFAVDGNGSVYAGAPENSNHTFSSITKWTPSGTTYTATVVVHSAYQLSAGDRLAIDGSGSIYISDAYLKNNQSTRRVIKETFIGGVYSESIIETGACQYSSPIAVDSNGNLYIADYCSDSILKDTFTNGSYTESTLSAGSLIGPIGIIVDRANNLYVSTGGGVFGPPPNIVKLTPSGNGSYSQTTVVTGGRSDRYGDIAADPLGNLYLVHTSLDSSTGQTTDFNIDQAVPSGTSFIISHVIPRTILDQAGSGIGPIAVDSSRNIYATVTVGSNSNEIMRFDVSAVPKLNFASTDVGSTSTDSPAAAQIENVGNAVLTFPMPSTGTNPSVSANFSLDGKTTTCPQVSTSGPAGSLNAGTSCSYGLNFVPTTSGTISGSLVLTDNALNGAGATQSIPLTGNGISNTSMAIIAVGSDGQRHLSWVSRNSATPAANLAGFWLDSYSPHYIAGIAEFITGTCTEIQAGKLSHPVDAVGASYTFGYEYVRLPNNQCPGQIYKLATVSGQWPSSSNQTNLQDVVSLQWTGDNGDWLANVTAKTEFTPIEITPATQSGPNAPLTATASLKVPPIYAKSYTWTITGGNGAVVFPGGKETITSTLPSVTIEEPNPTGNIVAFNLTAAVAIPDPNPLKYGPSDDVFDGVIISGSSKVVWWFNGQNPAPSAYPISVTLTSSAGPSTSWSVSQPDAKINLSSTSGAQITVTATGGHFSRQIGDVSITATAADGTKSAPFTMTAKTPWKLVYADGKKPSCSPPQTYENFLTYNLIDNLSLIMSTDVGWNEAFGACISENGSNWCNWAPIPTPGSTNPFIDVLAPPNLNVSPSPAPICTGNPSGTTRYESIPQTISVGTTNNGGVTVQSDTLGYYIDHGQHDSIQSPSQPPQ